MSNQKEDLVEIKEQYDYPTDIGGIKTSQVWYQVANVLYYVGNKRNDEQLLKLADNISNTVDKHMFDSNKNTYLSKMSADWNYSVDGLIDNVTLVLSAIYKLQKYLRTPDEKKLKKLNQQISKVEKIIVEKSHIISVKNLDNSLSIDSKVSLLGQSFLILLYKGLYNEFKENKYEILMSNAIDYVNSHFWDKKYSGYFSFVDIDGKIRIHKEFVVLLTPKTPAKYIFENSLFLVASSETPFSNTQRYQEAMEYLLSLNDTANGGFFIAEGYFWAAPGIPVGPFLRSVSPTVDTAGVVYFGSTKFVHFSNKYPMTQALCLLALKNVKIDSSKTKDEIITKSSLTPHFSNIGYQPVSHKKVDLSEYIDVKKHLRWVSNLYTPGQGFGWTPYVSPLGVKANKTSAVFGTQHALANLRILDETMIPNSESLSYWISLTQAENGAFSESPGEVSDVLYTYLAINALSIIGMTDIVDKSKCIDYLKSCQNEDGGFGINPGFKSDMFHSNLVLATLYTLGVEPDSNEGILNYTNSALREDGGYSEYSKGTSDTYSCYRAISTYFMYGLDIPDKNKTIQFLKECQNADGGFAQDNVGSSSLIATYHAVAALYMLDSAPDDVNNCINFLSSCQAPDGGIANIPGASTGTIDEGFAGIQSLAMLTNQLDKSYASIIS
ncbi:prenyltransferase/squalene oxidase repeat-containing protein [Lactococcus termiticola]|uniref:Geranylgeranyl transferase type II subunit beta n=1 Tax=Lactococcus termiticola TaxID=2169526 RepID=A0A2R5HHZ2_9LACT|nr:prenyltransferase/squalene oxidase repeat-containing protein [Lactococcus termiticola]GBG97556.1 cellobiose 2-epimerase [Lactococcus termiticola]